MKATTIFAALCTIAGVHAGCYSGGQTGNHEFGFEQLNGVCTEFINKGAFSSGEERTAVRGPDSTNTNWDFAVTYISSGTRDLGLDECIDGLHKEINGCTYGGETSYTNWKYK